MKVAIYATLALVAVTAVACVLDPGASAAVVAFITDPHAQTGMLLAEGAVVISPEEIKAALTKIGEQVRETGEKAFAEAKKAGDMTAETKTKVDELLVAQGGLQARLLEVEQKAARRPGPDQGETLLSAGSVLTDSPEFKAWVDAGGMKSTQSGYVCPVPRASLTSIATTKTTTVGVAPQQEPLIPGTMQRLTVRDLITPGRTSSNLIQYVKETAGVRGRAKAGIGPRLRADAVRRSDNRALDQGVEANPRRLPRAAIQHRRPPALWAGIDRGRPALERLGRRQQPERHLHASHRV
jgi:hypothetical protein